MRQIEHRSVKKLQQLQETQRLRNDIEMAFDYSLVPHKRHT